MYTKWSVDTKVDGFSTLWQTTVVCEQEQIYKNKNKISCDGKSTL